MRVGRAKNSTLSYTEWNDDQTIHHLIQSLFGIASQGQFERRAMNKHFTMESFRYRSGYTIQWTDNLQDHLWINEEHRTIMIYHNTMYLRNCLEYNPSIADAPTVGTEEDQRGAAVVSEGVGTEPTAGNTTGLEVGQGVGDTRPAATGVPPFPLPIALIEETIDTLDLLFPLDQARTRKFLGDKKCQFEAIAYERARCQQLADYHYWQVRLVDLVALMDEQPRGWRQVRWDRD
ncbi:hypothetical protein F5Y18DRAFT_359879 [Xylariaceae sp. FL1019]|nr:hypothetical protein F5Y18DRAFT_359879 [Xylariaceae sp. FL1019]